MILLNSQKILVKGGGTHFLYQTFLNQVKKGGDPQKILLDRGGTQIDSQKILVKGGGTHFGTFWIFYKFDIKSFS